MAIEKIKLANLGPIEESPIEYVQIGDAILQVKKYIPYEEMLDMIQWCIDYIINDRPFISEPLKKIIKDLAILHFFTNVDISFLTEYREMKEIYEEYDLVYRHGVMQEVLPKIDEGLLKFFNETLDATLESIMAYRNSAVGIVDALAENAKKDTVDMEKAVAFMNQGDNGEKIMNLLKFAEEIQTP